ncbi:MAG: hypothetical protein JWO80_1471 [Bryobacterales bacterium]|nr:hypothetical protein [Bryobacterales bacterium]
MRLGKVCLAMVLTFSAGVPAKAFDIILDPRKVSQLLSEIANFHQEWKTGKTREVQLHGLFEMGERVLDLTDLMTQDLDSHGASDSSLVALIERRLKENGIAIVKIKAGYHYDLAAFREYLRLSPSGSHALEAHYVLAGFDEPGDDVAGLRKSIAAKENFIRDYPKYPDVAVIELLLAQQHTQLARVYSALKQDELSQRQRMAAQERYRRIIKLYPSSEEAQTARDALNP